MSNFKLLSFIYLIALAQNTHAGQAEYIKEYKKLKNPTPQDLERLRENYLEKEQFIQAQKRTGLSPGFGPSKTTSNSQGSASSSPAQPARLTIKEEDALKDRVYIQKKSPKKQPPKR